MKIYPYQVKIHHQYLMSNMEPSFCKRVEKNLFDRFIIQKDVINSAVEELSKINFEEKDVKKITSLGAKVSFRDGQEAVNFAKEKNIKIDFGEVENDGIHAQWSKNQNKIIINKKYQNSNKIAEILAIAASVLHELSHAKDGDSVSSIQEEIDCLAMNSLAFNAFSKKYKNVFCGSQSKIIKDGVELYARLYFSDNKESLIKRISEKYGNLPTSSLNHDETKLAKEIKEHYLKTI